MKKDYVDAKEDEVLPKIWLAGFPKLKLTDTDLLILLKISGSMMKSLEAKFCMHS